MVSVAAEVAVKVEDKGWEEAVVKAEKAALDLVLEASASAQNAATLHPIRGVIRVIR